MLTGRAPVRAVVGPANVNAKSLNRICVVVFLLVWVNAMSFAFVAGRIGGDALDGKTQGDRYYVGYKKHYTEVSAAVFRYSQVHTYSVLVTLPLAALAWLTGYLLQRKEKAV